MIRALLFCLVIFSVMDDLSAQARKPADQSIKLSYFDLNNPAFNGWDAPAMYGETYVIDLAQRFTLPTNSGYVDSVRIYFVDAEGARLSISLFADTLYNSGNGIFHLMNDFSDPLPYGQTEIETAAILPNTWVTIDMGHAAVPKEFFVRVSPEDDGIDYISDYTLRTEREALRARTTENSRSAFFGYDADDNRVSAILDSTFTSNTSGEILIGDFWMEAFVTVDGASVSSISHGTSQLYPNPAKTDGAIHISDPALVTSVRIFNTLGVEVKNWSGKAQDVELSTQGLTKGFYHVIVTNDQGSTSEKLLID
jgi:hypothetical protein